MYRGSGAGQKPVPPAPARVCREAAAPLLIAPSVKAALDHDWSGPVQKAGAVKSLVIELENLKDWLAANLAQELKRPPLSNEVTTLQQLMDQDLEPDGGGKKIREGVAEDRRVSVEDPEMRHGRKSKTKRLNGYKRHIATDLDSGLILSGAITPANRPEDEAAPALADDIASQGLEIGSLVATMRPDGSDVRRLTTTPGFDCEPPFSPDGKKIVFTSDRAGMPQIFVMDRDGGNAGPLTTGPGVNTMPCWSPGGTEIAFVSDRDGDRGI